MVSNSGIGNPREGAEGALAMEFVTLREALVSMEISWDIRKVTGDLFCPLGGGNPNFEIS